jgi:hypothetical protein
MGVGHKMIMEKWGVPAAMMMCAGGFSFVGERAWLNDTVFCVDHEAVCNYMAAMYKKEKFYAAVPGQTWWLENNKLKKVDREAPFVRTEAESTWPSRVKLARKSFPDYTPATGRTTLADGELEALLGMLQQFACTLVGTTLFKSLYSMMSADSLGRKPTFAFVLRDGDNTRIYEYSAPACAFVEGVGDARTVYLAGFECWAPDLLAVLRGELGPIALSFGRARLWNAAPAKFSFTIFDEMYRMSHPLRRPAEQYAIYERTLRKQGDVAPSIGKR